MSLKMSLSLEVPRRASICAKQQEKFISGMDYFSVLKETEEGYVRTDYCQSCWEQSAKQEALENALTHWKSKVPPKEKLGNLSQNRDERALQLLKENLGVDAIEGQTDCFILALYLARRRLITLRQQFEQEPGHLYYLYEVVATEEMLTVKYVDIFQLPVDQLQKRIVDRFQAE